MKSKLVLIGGGGHCKACVDVVELEDRFEIIGILEKVEHVGAAVLGYDVIGTDEMIGALAEDGCYFLVAVGQVYHSRTREALCAEVEACGGKLATVVSPRAYVSRHASIGAGTIVMHDALINAGARIGRNCIVNSKALIEHDAKIEDHCHISTASVVNGGAIVLKGTFVGSNATMKEYVRTAEHDFVKAGSLFIIGEIGRE